MKFNKKYWLYGIISILLISNITLFILYYKISYSNEPSKNNEEDINTEKNTAEINKPNEFNETKIPNCTRKNIIRLLKEKYPFEAYGNPNPIISKKQDGEIETKAYYDTDYIEGTYLTKKDFKCNLNTDFIKYDKDQWGETRWSIYAGYTKQGEVDPERLIFVFTAENAVFAYDLINEEIVDYIEYEGIGTGPSKFQFFPRIDTSTTLPSILFEFQKSTGGWGTEEHLEKLEKAEKKNEENGLYDGIWKFNIYTDSFEQLTITD